MYSYITSSYQAQDFPHASDSHQEPVAFPTWWLNPGRVTAGCGTRPSTERGENSFGHSLLSFFKGIYGQAQHDSEANIQCVSWLLEVRATAINLERTRLPPIQNPAPWQHRCMSDSNARKINLERTRLPPIQNPAPWQHRCMSDSNARKGGSSEGNSTGKFRKERCQRKHTGHNK